MSGLLSHHRSLRRPAHGRGAQLQKTCVAVRELMEADPLAAQESADEFIALLQDDTSILLVALVIPEFRTSALSDNILRQRVF